MAGPILPRSARSPLAEVRRVQKARAKMKRELRKEKNQLLETWDSLPHRVQEVNSKTVANARFYDYLIDTDRLNAILEQIRSGLTQRLRGVIVDDVKQSYQIGTTQAAENLSGMTEDYTRDINSIVASEPYQSRIALLQTRVFEEMDGFIGQTAGDLSRVLTDAIADGQSPTEVKDKIRERFGVSESRAERIARTEITQAQRRGRWDEAQSAQTDLGIRTKLMHLSALLPTSRRTHIARHGNLYSVEEVREWYSVDGNAINCFLPGTEVQGRFVAGSKSRYEGPAVKLVTRSGKNLSVTPNHPVMTERGLVAAAEIREGDNLVAYNGDQKSAPRMGSLDGDLVQSRIENVFSSLSDLGHSGSRGVIGVDFHGDAEFMQENVEVVDVEGVLNVASNPSISKLLQRLALVKPDPVTPRHGAFGLDSFGIRLPASSLMGSAGKRLSGIGSAVKHSLAHAFASIPPAQAKFREPAGYADSGNSIFGGKLVNRLTGQVFGMHVYDFNSSFWGGVFDWVKSFGFHPGTEGAISDTDFVRESVHRFASLASFDEVVDVESFTFSGHVYDLEEKSGLMVANGIISSNCRCSQVEMLVDENGEPRFPSAIKKAEETRDKRRNILPDF